MHLIPFRLKERARRGLLREPRSDEAGQFNSKFQVALGSVMFVSCWVTLFLFLSGEVFVFLAPVGVLGLALASRGAAELMPANRRGFVLPLRLLGASAGIIAVLLLLANVFVINGISAGLRATLALIGFVTGSYCVQLVPGFKAVYRRMGLLAGGLGLILIILASADVLPPSKNSTINVWMLVGILLVTLLAGAWKEIHVTAQFRKIDDDLTFERITGGYEED